MSKLAFLPFIIIAVTAMLTWATARIFEISGEHREAAATQPRSRPYATTLPKSLTTQR